MKVPIVTPTILVQFQSRAYLVKNMMFVIFPSTNSYLHVSRNPNMPLKILFYYFKVIFVKTK